MAAALASLAVGTACTADDTGPPDDNGAPVDGRDAAANDAADAGAADAGSFPPTAVSARVSEDIVTVVLVSWETASPTRGYVEYGRDEAFTLATPPEAKAATQHQVALLGLKADTEYSYRVVNEADESTSEALTIRTGKLPNSLPPIELEGEPHDQYVVVPILGIDPTLVIIDPDGDIVWYHKDERELDFFRARLSNDKKTLIYNAGRPSGAASDSGLVKVALDGSGSTSIPIPSLAHDFVELPDGTLSAIATEVRPFEGDDPQLSAIDVLGNRIVEVDTDGEMTTVWTTWDCFDPAEVPGEDIEIAWSLANALDYDAEDDAYYLGMRNFSSIAKIDRQSGECEWVLGTHGSTFEFADGSARFLHQHQFQLDGDRIVLMDNDGSIGTESRVLEYELDFENQIATEVWSYTAEPPVYTFVLGETTRLSDGRILVNWSAAGQMDLVTDEGEATWKINTTIGHIFGFNTVVASLYPEQL